MSQPLPISPDPSPSPSLPDHARTASTLETWYQRMPLEVQLVFDHKDAWQTIVAAVQAPVQAEPEAASQAHDQVGRLCADLEQLPEHLDQWTGSAREAFEGTVGVLNEGVGRLADLTGGQLVGNGVQLRDQLVLDLVRTSVSFSIRSLEVARSLVSLTSGYSMTSWTTANLRQVAGLVNQVQEASGRVSALLDQLAELIADLTRATLTLAEELTSLQEWTHPGGISGAAKAL